jgi:hypothetical protein
MLIMFRTEIWSLLQRIWSWDIPLLPKYKHYELILDQAWSTLFVVRATSLKFGVYTYGQH